MSFWPDSVFSLATVGALAAATAYVLAWRGQVERRIVLALWANWLSVRLIRWYDFDNFKLWLLSDALTAIVLFAQGNRQARAIGGLFAFLMVFDHYTLLSHGGFDGPGAVAEAVGYVSLIILLWGGNVSLSGLGGPVVSRLAGIGRAVGGVPIRVSIFGIASVHGNGLASDQDTLKKSHGA